MYGVISVTWYRGTITLEYCKLLAVAFSVLQTYNISKSQILFGTLFLEFIQYHHFLRRVPAQDVLFALILWYVAKTLFRIVGIGPIPVKEL